MAEEVKIIDVAGGPAAEATLQELLKVMKQMDSKRGKGTGADGEAQKLYNESVNKGTTVKKGNTKASEENTSALNKATNALGNLAGRAISGFTSIIGNGISIATNLFKSFADGTGTLTDMIGQVPIFGSLLAMLTAPFDNTLQAFQSLASSGASFNNSLTDLRASAAGAKVSLDTFVSFISANTEKFATFGGTVTQGAEAFGRARKAMRAYEQDLLGMGLSFEEINEGLADYMALQRGGSRTQQRDMGQLAKQSADYSKTLMTLSKLTGQDVKALREKQMAEQNDLAFQLAKSRMSADEKIKLEQAMAKAMVGGPAAVARLKEEILGFPPMTRETQLFSATMSAADEEIRSLAAGVRNQTVTQDQFAASSTRSQARILAGLLSSAEDMETVITAGALSGEGVGNELLKILMDSGVDLAKYIGLTGAELENAILQDIQAAEAETGKRDDLVKGLTDFQNTLRNIRETIELNIIGPIGTRLGPQLTRLSDLFKNANETFIGPAVDRIGSALTRFIDDIEEFGFEETLKKLFEGAKTNIGSWIGDGIKTIFKNMLPSLDTALIGLAAGIATLVFAPIAAPFLAIGAALAAMFGWETIKGWVSDGWDAITGMFSSIGEWFSASRIREKIAEAWNSVTGVFSGITDWWNGTSFREMLSNAWNSVTGVFTRLGEWWDNFSFGAFVDNTLVAIWDSAAAAFGSISEWFSNFSLTNVLNGMWEIVKGWFSLQADLFGGIASLATDAWDTVTSFFSFGGTNFSISSVMSDAWNSVTSFFSFDGLQIPKLSDMFQGIIDTVKGFFSFDFQLPNFRDYLPSWLGGGGKELSELFGGSSAPGTDATSQLAASTATAEPITLQMPENAMSFGNLDFSSANAGALALQGTLANISSLQSFNSELDRMRTGLNADNVNQYNTAMENLVDTLEELNTVLAEDNKGMFGRGTGVSAANVIGGAGTGGSDQQLTKLDQLNTTMMMVLSELQDNTEFNRRISRSVRGNNLQA